MTSLPQKRQRTHVAQDGRRRATLQSSSPESSAPVRARQTSPALDPAIVFGCVDWFLYPDQAVGEAQRIPA